jgi:(1->4)-alpha-D-glucan 1-alpha-D-glucosylmutase
VCVALSLHSDRQVIPVRRPLATYRLQFNRSFTFRDASAVVDYLHALGIGDCYASSYLAAVPGSPHGYDVADPTQLNPELGSDEDYEQWVAMLKQHGMGHLLDVVPNHMGIAKSANPWWLDVLENGPSSRFARVFDIEWHPVKAELAGKVLIPILGDQYGVVLERQELTVSYQEGTFIVRYYDEVLPVAPDTFRLILGPALDAWVADHPGDEADELLSILTAADHLPLRGSRDEADIATRAREKEVVKRRLAALIDRSEAVRDYVGACVNRLNGNPGQPRSFDWLDSVLNAQSYRLAHWRVASEEINYRRFFDVNQLAAVRMEDPAVFEEVHRFVFELIRRGGPTGLRIDHVDGLFAPRDYLERLQSKIAETIDGGGPYYIAVEKILSTGEEMPADWPVAGTTGYEFAAIVNNLFVDSRSERAMDDIYRRFTRDRVSFEDLVYRSKKQVLHETMSGDINSLGHQLNRFSERNRHFRDFTLYSLISTLKDVIACFPVYRTYIDARHPVTAGDRARIRTAITCAKRRAAGVTRLVFDFVERLLLKDTPIATAEDCEERARFIGKFQQITSPVAAKGIEDTVLYVFTRLLSLNDVGSDPTQFGLEPAAVHAWMEYRQRCWPSALSATATHDTKRGEDVRARLNVLSEIPGAWKTAVAKWRLLNRRFKTEVRGESAPDANEEYFLYQTLVGMWPFERDDGQVRERLRHYIVKSMREAKVHSSWLSPDEEHEHAVLRFVDAILDRRRSAPFLQSFEELWRRVAEHGIYNSLSQLLIKITAPGVPDFYQGTELWDFNLVDPDNRRPVDYTRRRAVLDALNAAGARNDLVDALLHSRQDGRIKMFVIARALAARAQRRDAFELGDYLPLQASGARRESLFAFARTHRTDALITCVPRLPASLVPDASAPPIGSAVWADTALELPAGPSERFTGPFIDLFTGARLQPIPSEGRLVLPAAALFDRLPVALLAPCST